MSTKTNSLNIWLDNRVHDKFFKKYIFIDDTKYSKKSHISPGKHTIYVKSVFKSKSLDITFAEGEKIVIDFKATLFRKCLIGGLSCIITLPIFYINALYNLYPILPTLVWWLLVWMLYNPIAIFKTTLKIRTFK